MPTKEELQLRYSTYATENLLDIIDHKFDYTDLAVMLAIEELAKRNITEDDIKNYKAQKTETEVIRKNFVDGLSLLQKNLFYFLWIPILNFAFKMNYRDDGYLLKLRQANYYSLCGFLGLGVSAIVSIYFELGDIHSLAIWIAMFIPAYLLDKHFNKQWLSNHLETDSKE
jgi:hypothetical protein